MSAALAVIPEAALNWSSLIGMLLLAYPALSLDRRKRDLDRVERILEARDEAARGSLLAQLGRDVQRRRGSALARWRALDRVCLYGGYIFLLVPLLVRALRGTLN